MYSMTVTFTEHVDSTLAYVSVSEIDESARTEHLFTASSESAYESPYATGDPLLTFLTRAVDCLDQALSTSWVGLDRAQ